MPSWKDALYLYPHFEITVISDSPDFIISNGETIVGLEHQ
jgi:hypothetical protein